MDYEFIDVIFAEGTENLPDAPTLLETFRNSLTASYLTDYVWTVSDSAFTTANEVVMRISDLDGPP